jgi:hypothetical protein
MSESHQKCHDKKENLILSTRLSYQDFIVAVGTKRISYKIVPNVQLKLPEDTVDGSFIKLYSISVFLILFSFIASFPILAIIWKQSNMLIGISLQAGLFLVYTLIYKYIQFKPLLINTLYSLIVFLSIPSFLFFGLKNPITISFLELSIGIFVFYIFRSFNEKWLMDMVIKNEETYVDAIDNNKITIDYKTYS